MKRASIPATSEEIDRLSCEIIDKQANKLDDSFVSSRLSSIWEAMNRLRNFTRFDRERILNYIDRIYMHPNGDIELILKSGYGVDIHGTERNDRAITDTTDATYHELATTFKMGIQHVGDCKHLSLLLSVRLRKQYVEYVTLLDFHNLERIHRRTATIRKISSYSSVLMQSPKHCLSQ